MRLGTLLKPLLINFRKSHQQDIEIKGIAFNSSKIEKNYLFIAIPGNHNDGHHFIEDAIKNGASAIIGEQEMKPLGVPYFRVQNARKVLATIAKNFYQNPTENKIMIGITGTNGKTTTSYMLKHILEMQGISCALFGSVSTVINGIEKPSSHTTLDPLTFHQLLSTSKDQIAILEVSSHGLNQHRVEGIEFDYCIFTNLEHEHLDYHIDMESYFKAKQSLFTHLKTSGIAIVNSFSDWGERLSAYVNSIEKHVIKVNGYKPIYFINGDEISRASISDAKSFPLTTSMRGKHNIENAALAFSTAVSLGINPSAIVDALKEFKGIPGRFQLFSHPNGATFVIDYAHTANAFYHILDTARSQEPRKIIHIFGFRGNRDVLKRKKMVEISLKKCDYCILTFDDLNGVSPKQMMHELESFSHQEKCIIIPDRTLAIKHAWDQAQNQDWIVITGKGNELYQHRYSLPTTSDLNTLNYLNDLK
ncbi:MAG: UDP-N-acetylmuramoyl-L-alanyl-D-glutamate--2,6-diaminopimelate ligase [Paenisporosarcina sp.]|nr:UDP-N-acetylmuramoyl-L-alanyl-D-glutamate--2,6-diaminopimelate ligase [Paenisporosarcina sp.]